MPRRDLRKIRAVLFDLDNTLMDFMRMKESAIQSAVDAMIDAGLPLHRSKALQHIDRLYHKYGIENQRIFNAFLEETLGKVDNKVLAAGVVAYRRVKEGFVEPYPNVASTLLELSNRGYVLGIISDAPAFQAWSRLVGMKLHHFFSDENVITLGDTGVRKPSELPFAKAIEKLRLKPDEMLMVGDDPHRDVAGSNKFGMISVLAKYGNYSGSNPKLLNEGEEADYVIDDVKDLLNFLPTRNR
ncbi:MAG: HAD family hydrolase [Candidatus Bathyarchaeia archaeon]